MRTPPVNRTCTHRITASDADLFHECPRAFWERRADRGRSRQQDDNFPLRRGKAGHAFLERIMLETVKTGRTPEPEAAIARFWNGSYFANDEEALKAYLGLSNELQNVYAFLQAEELTVLAAEQQLESRARMVAPGANVVLSGKVDLLAERLDGQLVVLDYKWSNSLPVAEDLAARPSSMIYYYVVSERYPEQSQVEIVQLLPTNGMSVNVVLSEDEIEASKAVIRQVVSALHAGAETMFEPRQGEPCRACAWSTCPRRQDEAADEGF